MKRLSLNLGAYEHAARERAEKLGMTLNAYIRYSIAQELQKELEPDYWGVLPCRDGSFRLPMRQFRIWQEAFPGLDIGEELSQYQRWERKYLYSSFSILQKLTDLFERRLERDRSVDDLPERIERNYSKEEWESLWQGWVHCEVRSARRSGAEPESLQSYQRSMSEPRDRFIGYEEWVR